MKTRSASPGDLAAATLAFLIPVGYLTAVTAQFWTVKAALVLVAIPVGLVCLVGLLTTEGDRAPAIAALAFLGIALAAVAFSDNPYLAFFGNYARGTGWLFVAALVAMWALGKAVTPAGVRLVGFALGAATVVNALIALLQHVTDLSSVALELHDGRATGLVGNPVQAATLFVGGTYLATNAFREDARWGAVLVAAAAGIQASGSRFALAALVVAAAWALVSGRDRRALMLVALLVVGAAIGTVAVGATKGTSSTDRIATGVRDNSTKQRLYTWQSSLTALRERPLLGTGPGRYVTGAERYRPLSLVRAGGDAFFDDAHNVVVEYAVTTGLAGVSALGAFVLLAFRKARGPLAAFSFGMFGMLLVQPLHVATVPLGFLALGAAAPAIALGWSRVRVAIGAVGTAFAVAAAGVLVAGDARLREAQLDYSTDDAIAAGRMLPRWPQVPRQIARMYVFYAETEDDPSQLALAVEMNREAVARDRPDPRVWEDLGAILVKVGDLDGAEEAYQAAVERNPRRIAPNLGLMRVASANGDFDAARRYVERVAELRGERDDVHEDLLEQIDEAERKAQA